MWKIDKASKSGTTTAAYQNALDWKTEELAAKLKLATRVADLIFRMQAQQAQPVRVR